MWRASGGIVAVLLAACSSEPVGVVITPAVQSAATCVEDEDCDDGLVCSGLERCLDGRCWSGRPPRCDDHDPCTRDLCLEPNGCSYLPVCGLDAGPAVDASPPEDAQTSDGPWRDAGAYVDSGSSFSPRLPAYCEPAGTIMGDVRASEQATLEQLAGVRCIFGRLDVGGIAIRSLTSLSALRWVGGELIVHDAPALQTIAGLDALERVEGPLSLLNLGGSPSLEPLNALVDVAGALTLKGIAATRLGGFASLTHVGGELRVELALQNVESAFPQLQRIDGKLALAGAAFVTFDGFPALRQILGDLELPNGVVALRGFRALTLVQGKLLLPKDLTQLAAFDVLESVHELELTLSKLQVLDGFRALRKALTALRISGPLLESIAGFDQLENVGTLTLGALPKLARLTGFRNLSKVGTLSVYQTKLEALPFERLSSCDTLALSGNTELRDASTLARLSNLGALNVSDNPALVSLSVGVTAQMRELTLRENLTLSQLTLRGLDRFVSGITVIANPALSRCLVDQLAARTTQQGAQSELCCNQGCARCGGVDCAEAGGIDAGQSTQLSYLDVNSGTDLRALVNAESAEYVEVNNYDGALALLPNFRSVTRDFNLRQGSNLADLSPFAALESVGGELSLYYPRRLSSLAGLSALRSVGGTLSIESAKELRDLALPALRTVGGVSIWGVPYLNTCQTESLRRQLGVEDAGTDSFDVSVARCSGTCVGSVCQ